MAKPVKIGDRWRVQIRKRGSSYCKTFSTKAQAERWARDMQHELENNAAPKPHLVTGKRFTVSQMISEYRRMREKARPISDDSTEHYTLKKLDAVLGHCDAEKLTPDDLVGYCETRKDSERSVGPYTLNMDISKLGTVMRYTSAFLRIDLPDVVAKARPLLSHLKLIGGGGKRERRPTEDELHNILVTLEDDYGQLYADAVRFAVATAMRRGEIVKLLWSDIDNEKRLILVRDRKDPREKAGNDQWIPLLDPAWDLLQVMDRKDERIFPVHEQTLSKYFKAACEKNNIVDLHFHDLRHEGTSRLFEEGYSIEQVALVTGHKSWNMLKRYVQLKPESLVTHKPGP